MSISSQRRDRARKNLGQFVKFGIVGGSGVLVNMLVAVIMNKANGGDVNARRILFPLWSGFNFRFSDLVWIVGFLVAVVTNFQLNRTWTFPSSKHASWWKEFWPFFAVGSVAAIVGFFLKIAMTNPTSPFCLPDPYFHNGKGAGLQSREYWAQLIAIILTIPINFLVNKFWTFRAVRHLGAAATPQDLPMVAPAVAPEFVIEDSRVDERAFTDSADAPEQKG